MYNIFNDDKLQSDFEKDGFVKLSQVLNNAEIFEIKKYYLDLTHGQVENSRYGMYVSLDEKDQSKKIDTMKMIQDYLKPKLGKYLHDFKSHLGSFLVKVPNPNSYTYPHQDWLFIDNDLPDMFSATIWVSLEDIDVHTGTLGFIKGSHRFLNNIIGSPSPEIITATMGHEALLLNYLTFPEVKAGDALIFNNKTVHAAFPNTTDKDRIAIGIGITPHPAVLHHYYLNPTNNKKIYKLTVDEGFFYTYNNDMLRETYNKKKLPNYTHIVTELDYTPTMFSIEEMIRNMEYHENLSNNLPTPNLFGDISFMDKAKYAFKFFLNKFGI
jgi:ectoine hydroxylase-related dioxygenase (phytanoyl-CoA dioxygenase family)